MYRAKFRVLTRTERASIKEGTDGVWRPSSCFDITMQGVNPRNDWNKEGSEENLAFWDASPAGSFNLEMLPEEAEAFPVGQAVYIDFEPDETGTWRLQSADLNLYGQIDVVWYPNGRSGSFKLSVGLASTIEKLVQDCVAQFTKRIAAKKANPKASLGAEGNWSILLTPAPG